MTPRQLKSNRLLQRTARKCYNGDAINNPNTNCTEINSAPVCSAIIENGIYQGEPWAGGFALTPA